MSQEKLPFGDRHPILLLVLSPLLLPLLLVALVAGIFSKPVVRTRSEVADILESFVDGNCDDYVWDDFVCGGKIADPELEAIRSRCASLDDEFPATQRGHYCGEGGMQVMRGYVQELRSVA